MGFGIFGMPMLVLGRDYRRQVEEFVAGQRVWCKSHAFDFFKD